MTITKSNLLLNHSPNSQEKKLVVLQHYAIERDKTTYRFTQLKVVDIIAIYLASDVSLRQENEKKRKPTECHYQKQLAQVRKDSN